MIIDIHTDQLETVVQMARTANEAISDAANLLNSVVAHDDWQCPERNEINSSITQNRSLGLTLQADAERLYSNVFYAAQRFLEVEQEVCNSFNAVDAPIASFLSQVPDIWTSPKFIDQPQGHNPGQILFDSVWDTAADAMKSAGGGAAGVIKQTVDMVSFGSIADAMKGE